MKLVICDDFLKYSKEELAERRAYITKELEDIGHKVYTIDQNDAINSNGIIKTSTFLDICSQADGVIFLSDYKDSVYCSRMMELCKILGILVVEDIKSISCKKAALGIFLDTLEETTEIEIVYRDQTIYGGKKKDFPTLIADKYVNYVVKEVNLGYIKNVLYITISR